MKSLRYASFLLNYFGTFNYFIRTNNELLFLHFIQLLHVLEEVGTPLKSDEKLCILVVASIVGGLNCDGLSTDLLECGIVIPY